MADKNVNIAIRVKDFASGTLKQLGASAGSITGVFKSFAQGIVGSMSGVTGSIAMGVASGTAALQILTAAAKAAGGAIVSAIKSALAKEDELKDLAAIIDNTGQSFEQLKPKVEQTFSYLASQTPYAGSQIRTVFSDLVKVTGDANSSLQLLPLALDLVESGTVDVETVGRALGQTLGGNTMLLGRNNAELRNMIQNLGANASNAQKAQVAIDFLQQRYGGLATGLDSTDDKLSNFNNRISAMKTQIGTALLPAIDRVASSLLRLFDEIGKGTSPFLDLAAAMGVGIKLLIDYERYVYHFFAGPTIKQIAALSQAVGGDFAGALETLKSIPRDFLSSGKKFATDIRNITPDFAGMRKSIQGAFGGASAMPKFDKGLNYGIGALDEKSAKSGASKTEKEVTVEQKQQSLLSAKQAEIHAEIVNKRLEGLDALNLEHEKLSAILPQLEKMKGNTEAVVTAKERLWNIENEIAKTNEDATQKEIDAQNKALKEWEDAREKEAAELKRIAEEKAAQHERDIANLKERSELAIRNKSLELGDTQGAGRALAEYVAQNKAQLLNDLRSLQAAEGDLLDVREALAQANRDLAESDPAAIAARRTKEINSALSERISAIDAEAKSAAITGGTYDKTAERVRALTQAYQELTEAGLDASLVQKDLTQAVRQLQAEKQNREDTERYKAVEKQQEDAIKRLNESIRQQTHDDLANSIETAITDGGRAGLRSLLDQIKSTFVKKAASSISDWVLGLGGEDADGGKTPMGGASGFAAGWSMMSDKLSGGASTVTGGAGGGGGFFKKLLGGGGLFGSPLGLGIGAIALLGGLFGKKSSPTFSGVEQIFSGINARGGDFGGLYGSDVFERATFSSRNRYNDVLRSGAGTRGLESTVKIVPSKEFDAISEDKWVQVSRMNEIKGVPNRTGFNHG